MMRTETSRRTLDNGGVFPDDVKRAAWKIDGGCCRKCGRDVVGGVDCTYDHIHPWSRGGANTLANCRVLCSPCNGRKRDSMMDAHLGEARDDVPAQPTSPARSSGVGIFGGVRSARLRAMRREDLMGLVVQDDGPEADRPAWERGLLSPRVSGSSGHPDHQRQAGGEWMAWMAARGAGVAR